MKIENNNVSDTSEEIDEAVWQEKRKGLSTVWIVPIVALIVGAWLMFQNFNEKGPMIEIRFKSAEGVQAEKTVLKYKDIEVGKVKEVNFADDLQSVIVTAEVKKNMKPFLSEKTRFWVMKAKLGLNGVEGLDTLLSGVYIVMDPAKGEEYRKEFNGLDSIPVVSTSEKGTRYYLKADTIGSLEAGSPIYYKKLQAGAVASYVLDSDGKRITIEVFIKAPFDNLINKHTRFWNASGITADIGTDGVEIHTESLTSILSGGIAFDTFRTFGSDDAASANHEFKLYASLKKAKKIHYKKEIFFWVYFDSSIRGLSEGAPVEFRGVKIGEVVTFSLIGNAKTAKFDIPILVKIEPERFMVLPEDEKKSQEVNTVVLKELIANGFRAQLKTGNLLTGELYVDMNMYKDVKPASLIKKDGLYVLPSIPGTIESLKANVQEVLANLAAIPMKEIGDELKMTLKDVRSNTLPALNDTIRDTNRMMTGASSSLNALQKNYLDSNAEVNKKIIRLLDEMTQTSRSIKNLTNYLERHPESLIKGK